MYISFCIPTTTKNRDWKNIEESYIYKYLLNTLPITTKYFITIYFGIDYDDYLIKNNKQKIIKDFYNKFKNIKIKFYEYNESGNVCHIWNELYKESITDNEVNNAYFWIVGDDIDYSKILDYKWLDDSIKKLSQNNDIGISGCYNGNPNLPMTQFLISKKHYEIFNFIFPKSIKNWYCDNYLLELYGNKYCYYLNQYTLLNSGGKPRYEIIDAKRVYKIEVKRNKPKLRNYINKNL